MSRSPSSSISASAQPPNIEASGRRGRVDQVGIHGKWIDCDLVVMSGSPQPNYKLLAQAGARVEYDAARGIFVPTDLPQHVEAVGAAAGDVGEPAVPPPVLGHRGDKCFVCFCEDQTTKDLKYAIAEGFDSIELAKRYTTVTMGPCQGRLCHVNSIRRLREGDRRRREHDRHDDRAAAVRAGLARTRRRAARTSRPSARRCTTATRISAGR